VTPAEEILVSCIDKAVIVSLCPLTGNRLFVLAVFELGITKRWHAVCLASGMLAVRAARPCPRVWLIGAGLLREKMVRNVWHWDWPVTFPSLFAAMGGMPRK